MEVNGSDQRFGAILEDRVSFELRLMVMFMPPEDVVVLPPTYWLESDATVRVILRNAAFFEQGFAKFLMNERTFEDFRQKKNYRYRKLIHIARFKKGYAGRRRDPLIGLPITILGKSFAAGHDTLSAFKRTGVKILRSVFSRQEDIDYFLDGLETTQSDVFIWESVVEELRAADVDVGRAARAGLRAEMDRTYYGAYASAGFLIPGGSEINHMIVIPSEWSKWCRLDRLRLVTRYSGLESWMHSSTAQQLQEVKLWPEWRRFAATVRNWGETGRDLDALLDYLQTTKDLQHIGKETRKMSVSTDRSMASKEETIIADIAFLSVNGVKSLDAKAMAASLQAMSDIVRLRTSRTRDSKIFATITGCIVLSSDRNAESFVSILADIYVACRKVGVDLNIGIHRGVVPLVRDVDGTITPISPEINKAARLAYTDRKRIETPEGGNASVMASLEFADFAAQSGHASETHDGWLLPINRAHCAVRVSGKRDETFDVLVAPHDRFPKVEGEAGELESAEVELLGGCLLIAYDLPKFSDGDQSRVTSRFFDVSRVVRQRLAESSNQSELIMSPGGDGAILIVTGMSLSEAYNFANDVHDKLNVLDRLRTEDAGTSVRVGVHYAGVAVYLDGTGTKRGTGAALFIADDLANDEKGREEDVVVFSSIFKSVAAHGDESLFRERFRVLTPLMSSTGIQVERFVRKEKSD